MTAEILNWIGHILRGPRTALGRIHKCLEAQKTGVYEDGTIVVDTDGKARTTRDVVFTLPPRRELWCRACPRAVAPMFGRPTRA